MQRCQLTGLICTLVFSLIPFSLHARSELRFGVYTTDKPTAMVRKFRPVLNALESAMTHSLGEPVTIRMQVAKGYEQGMQDLVTGKVDFVRFGAASYVMAKQANPHITILAVESHHGKKRFHGMICVRQDSPVRHVSELKGKSFAFGDERSTLGRYLPQQFLFEHGIRAADLVRIEYLGRHDTVGAAVGAGTFDAGALKESTFHKLVAKGVPLRAIAMLPVVTKPWIARSWLPEHLFTALQTALLNMKVPKALKALGKDGFLHGSDADYEGVRTAMARVADFELP
jgi:phosphonate transport system substrate-binding protein